MTTMTQCRMERNGARQDAWIETKFAEPGRRIKIKTDGAWEDGWVVETAGNTLPAEVVRQNERNYKNHRIATDV